MNLLKGHRGGKGHTPNHLESQFSKTISSVAGGTMPFLISAFSVNLLASTTFYILAFSLYLMDYYFFKNLFGHCINSGFDPI